MKVVHFELSHYAKKTVRQEKTGGFFAWTAGMEAKK